MLSFVHFECHPDLRFASIDVLSILITNELFVLCYVALTVFPINSLKHFQDVIKIFTELEANFNTNSLFFKIFKFYFTKNSTRA